MCLISHTSKSPLLITLNKMGEISNMNSQTIKLDLEVAEAHPGCCLLYRFSLRKGLHHTILCALHIDYSQAFDGVNSKQLLDTMKGMRFPIHR